MPQGTIKKLISERGFGFITSSGQELFFHQSSVVDGGFDSLAEGQSVEFEVDATPSPKAKGPRAVQVKGV